jgi:hypothetical protein
MHLERNFSDGRSRSLGPTYFLPQEQQPSYSSELLLQSIMADHHPFRMPSFPSTTAKPAPTTTTTTSNDNKVVLDDGRPLLLLGGGDIISTCASSITHSEMSSQPTQSTDWSSLWSHKDPVPLLPRREPPQVIKVTPRQPRFPTTLPYAQLCFDPEKNTLVTLMEINLGGNGRRSKRLRILDSNEASPESTPAHCLEGATATATAAGRENPSLFMASYSSASTTTSTESTGSSTRSNGHAEEKEQEPNFLSQDDIWLEETDLDLYLLHDFEVDPWNADPRGGCTEALKKMLLASRSFLVFRHRHHHQQDYSKESSFRINYQMLDNETNSGLDQ